MSRKNYRTKPAKHAPYRPIGNCADKNSYASRQAAMQVAADQMKYSDVVLKPYFCPDCSKWHLTSVKNQ